MDLFRSFLGFFRCCGLWVVWVCLVHFGVLGLYVYELAGVWVVELIVDLRLFWAC